MAPKDFYQFFGSEFQGIDGQRSALEPEGYLVNKAQNMEMSIGNSLRGRVGSQTSGSYGFFAIFPYRYTRTQDQYDIVYQTAAGTYPTQTASLATTKTTADGASIEKLIGINKQVWILDTMNITITQTNAGAYTWYSAVSGSNINFNIKKDGSSILSTSVGDGITSNVSIYSLLGTIDALSDLAVSRTTRGTCPPFALANGAQTSAAVGSTSYGSTYSWTVTNTPHNFQVGDIISWVNSSTGLLQGGIVTATTATLITYVGPQGVVGNGQVLGYQAQYASNFPISTVSSESGGVFTLSMPYWRLIPEGDKDFGHIYDSAYSQWQARSSGSFYAPPVAENQLGNLYIAASSQVSAGSSTWANNLIKMDSMQVSRTGLPAPTIAFTNGGAGAPGLTGTYKYKAFYRRYDAQGNIIDGPVSDTTTLSLTADFVQIDINNSSPNQLYSAATGFQVRSCYKNTTESPAAGAAFYVDDAVAGLPFIQPGDVICLTDTVTQTAAVTGPTGTLIGSLHVTRCTAVSPQATTISPTSTSIRVADSNGYTITTDTPISAGLTIVILRTTAGGNQFYNLVEVPVSGFFFYRILEEATDATLEAKEQFLEPEIGKEHDAPPACTLVCAHQGGLVVARGPTSPNTVTASTAEGLEYFPAASNSFDVPSTQVGFITAIASDSDDRLSVFKERAYYDVVGVVDEGNFAINIRNEGDYGITSQASLVRLPFGLLGLSKNGWVVISDGTLDPFRYEEVNARVINQNYQFAWATAVNDYFNRQYICTIPQVTGEPVGFTFDYSRRKNAPDQVYTKTMERSYPTQIDQAGGGAMVGDTLYHLSQTSPYGVFRRLVRFNGDSPSGNGDGDSFIDNTSAIPYILELAPINRGEPELLRQAERVRVWSIPNDYVVEGWVPFSLLVEAGYTPFTATIANSNTGSSSTLTFTTEGTDFMKDLKLKGVKSQFLMLRFTSNTIRTAPFLTGIGVMYAKDYQKEDFIK